MLWKTIGMLLMSMLNISSSGASTLEQKLVAEAESHFEFMQEIRRTIHQYPELMFQEEKTSAYIREQLKKLDIPFKHPVVKTGIVATIGTGKAPKFALRSDIDALPIHETADVEFKSKVDGKMHACGHDSHIAMLLGAAKILKARESEIRGTVVLIFQPAEEGGAGGKFMVDEGVVKDVLAIHGLHIWPTLPSGVITSKLGTMMAGADEFRVELIGKGGHAAMPDLTIDPVVAGAAVVQALQHLVSRVTKPTEGAVISVTRFSTGEGALNVIPDSVQIGGTLRALTLKQFNDLRTRIDKVIKTVASAHECQAKVDWIEIPYIPNVNNADMVKVVETVATKFGDKGEWQVLQHPSFGGEDFAFFADAIPAAFTFLGTRNETVGAVHGVHTAQFILDETVLPRGAALHAAVAFEFLNSRQGTLSREEL